VAGAYGTSESRESRRGQLSVTDQKAPRPTHDVPRLAAIDVAADFLDVHPRTVRRMIHAGELRGYRVARLVKVDMTQVYALATPVPPESVSA
jgi:excisionase family DNA binding protein